MSRTTTKSKSLFIKHLLSEAACDGRRLVQLAEQAIAVRAFDTVALIGARLCELSGVYSSAGELYLALALNRTLDNRAQAESLLLAGTESLYPALRARAFLALGNHFVSGNPLEAVSFYRKAVQLNRGCPLNLFCSAMMTVAAGRGGLDALNSLYPLARYVGRVLPAYGMDYLNSVAVELNTAGHVEQARRVIAPVIVSPFATRYPEWMETAEEINQECKPQVNVLAFPVSRVEQVRRIEKVIWDKAIDGYRLKRYANAGEGAIA